MVAFNWIVIAVIRDYRNVVILPNRKLVKNAEDNVRICNEFS